jgi:hypothetical protein
MSGAWGVSWGKAFGSSFGSILTPSVEVPPSVELPAPGGKPFKQGKTTYTDMVIAKQRRVQEGNHAILTFVALWMESQNV